MKAEKVPNKRDKRTMDSTLDRSIRKALKDALGSRVVVALYRSDPTWSNRYEAEKILSA